MTYTNAYQSINISNVTTVTGMLDMANTSTGGMFWAGMVMMISLVSLVTLAGAFGLEAGLLASLFVGLILGMLLYYLALVPIWLVGAYVGGLLITILYIVWRNPYD